MKIHSFHIPVMGTGFTIDSPVKVAHFGISSVISIGDHRLLEKTHKFYADKYNIQYTPIDKEDTDRRSKIITAYLNLVDELVTTNLDNLRSLPFAMDNDLTKYFEMLHLDHPLRKEYILMLKTSGSLRHQMQANLKKKLVAGDIDVNIMTKLDKVNYNKNKEALPVEFNDAHAAIRGFVNSKAKGAVVLSAGLNPRLFNYMSGFEKFFQDSKGCFEKKIIVKVSDYRSAIIQGKFLAKKGLWTSEFRIESGLNCGGHAFATDGYLLGPILQEFKDNYYSLKSELTNLYNAALASQGKPLPVKSPEIAITVQGGVGTAEEHSFLLKYYRVNSVGWGTPFLLVPEAVSIDEATMQLLAKASEKDIYLSNVSPLGIPFNSVSGNTAELQRLQRIDEGKPGSPCIKEHLVSSVEFSEAPLCTASRAFQKRKIKELKDNITDTEVLSREIDNVTQKTCLCMGLANASLTANNITLHKTLNTIAVCPGPNMAYFSKIVTLKEMVNHIYGKENIMEHPERPHMFIKELKLYIDYFKSKLSQLTINSSEKEKRYLEAFGDNLIRGISYYKELYLKVNHVFGSGYINQLNKLEYNLSKRYRNFNYHIKN